MSFPRDSETEEHDEFVTLIMRHRHSLYAFIAKQLVNPSDVEDVFQKTSLILWKKMPEYDREGSFFHWACGIAFNEVRNHLAVARRRRLHFDDELIQLIADEAREESELTELRLSALRECISRLSDRQQIILRRCYSDSESITEVAKQVGKKRDALYKQLERLRAKLLDCIRVKVTVDGVRR